MDSNPALTKTDTPLLGGYDEPETLRYAITSNWPRGADGGHILLLCEELLSNFRPTPACVRNSDIRSAASEPEIQLHSRTIGTNPVTNFRIIREPVERTTNRPETLHNIFPRG